MKRKQLFIMLATMTVLLGFSLYFFGWFTPDREIILLAESHNWQLSLNEEKSKDPYLIYTGNGSIDENIQVQGIQFYDASATEAKVDNGDSINKELAMEHFVIAGVPLGENRWYLNENNAEQSLQGICMKLTWTVKSEAFSEYIISENLSEAQIAQAKEASL